jgi:hypothetical protein
MEIIGIAVIDMRAPHYLPRCRLSAATDGGSALLEILYRLAPHQARVEVPARPGTACIFFNARSSSG